MKKKRVKLFLAFYLNEKNYAFPILKVNEVIVLPEITPIPKAPTHMKGVINLRGAIIPIIDLRIALDIENVTFDKTTCVIIVNVFISNTEKMIGFIVDSVSEVFEISSINIEAPPNFGETNENAFLKGIGKVKDKIVMLLDIDTLLANDAAGLMNLELEDCIV